jgi:glutamyl/glutaminyl-tRNA synthetase
VDDIRDGVTEVVRGADLLDYSAVQIHLWRALGASPPTWLHGPLILGVDGRKLSKSHDAFHVGALRAAGWEPQHVWSLVLPWLGLPRGVDRLQDAAPLFRPTAGHLGPILLRLGDGLAPPPGTPIPWHPLPG